MTQWMQSAAAARPPNARPLPRFGTAAEAVAARDAAAAVQ
jgi:hypothetical protein